MRRAFTTAAALLLAVSLAACGNSSSGDDEGSGGGTVTIGLLSPLTGGIAQTAEIQRNAVQLRVDQINDDGGVDGKKIELKVYDTKLDPAVATQQAQRAISQDKVTALIGPWTSTEALAVGEVVERAKVVEINSSAAAEAITEGKNYIFRTSPLTRDLTKAMVQMGSESGAASGALLHDNSSFGLGAKEPIETAAKAADFNLVDSVEYPLGATDVSAQVAAIAKNDPGVVFIAGGGGAEYGLIAKAMVEQGLNVPLIGFSPLISADAIKIAAGAYDTLPGAYTLGCLDSSKPQYKEFLEQYKEKYGEVGALPEQVLQAVDALDWIAKGLEESGGKGGDCLATALTKLPAAESLSGRAGAEQQFTADDHDGYGEAYLVPYKVENGAPVQSDINID